MAAPHFADADEISAHRDVNELGAGFLAKPFSPAVLREAVEIALRKHPAGDPPG